MLACFRRVLQYPDSFILWHCWGCYRQGWLTYVQKMVLVWKVWSLNITHLIHPSWTLESLEIWEVASRRFACPDWWEWAVIQFKRCQNWGLSCAFYGTWQSTYTNKCNFEVSIGTPFNTKNIQSLQEIASLLQTRNYANSKNFSIYCESWHCWTVPAIFFIIVRILANAIILYVKSESVHVKHNESSTATIPPSLQIQYYLWEIISP